MSLKDTYNKIARDWARDHEADVWWIEGIDKFLSLLVPASNVLDVGCGSGNKSRYMSEKGFLVTGIDFSGELLKIAQESAPSATFLIKDITAPLDLAGAQFDGVLAHAVLLHIPKKEIIRVVKNISTPLKIGGYFYLVVKEKKEGGKDEEVLVENDYGYEYERFFSFFTLEEIKGYLHEVGLRVVYENRTTIGKTTWIQIITQK